MNERKHNKKYADWFKIPSKTRASKANSLSAKITALANKLVKDNVNKLKHKALRFIAPLLTALAVISSVTPKYHRPIPEKITTPVQNTNCSWFAITYTAIPSVFFS